MNRLYASIASVLNVVRYGTPNICSRFRCKTCHRIFKTGYVYLACEIGPKEQIIDISLNCSGIRGPLEDLRHSKKTLWLDVALVRIYPSRESSYRQAKHPQNRILNFDLKTRIVSLVSTTYTFQKPDRLMAEQLTPELGILLENSVEQ